MKQRRRKKIIQSAIGIVVCMSMLVESSPLLAMSYEQTQRHQPATAAPSLSASLQAFFALAPATGPHPAWAEPSPLPTPPPSAAATPSASLAPAAAAGVPGKFTAAFNKPHLQSPSLAEIPLLPDWNLVSIPTEQVDTDPTAVLAGIAGDYNVAFAYDGCNSADPWQIYDPAAPPVTNDLTAVDHTIGFWIQATTETAVPVSGSVPPTTTMQLCTGWNLIGMPTEQARPVRNALFSIEGKYTLVFGYNPADTEDPWELYDVNAPAWANDLEMMQPGRGYWVLATEDTTLTLANEGEPPVVEIFSPEETTTELTSITFITDVIGTAYSDFLANWALAFRSQGESQWTPLASNTAPVINGILGQFDPTLLLNGLYELQLTATDYTGQVATTQVSVIVEGNLKLGHFTLPLLDLEVPIAGLPIQVVRTYDSRNKQEGDFGVGWTMSVNNVSLQENGVPGVDWLSTRGGVSFPTYCILPARAHIVSVTLPDDSVYLFRPVLNPSCQPLVPQQVVNISYQPLPGTEATLTPLDHSTQVLVIGGFPGLNEEPRPIELWDQLTTTIHDANSYRLTLRDGRELVIDQESGLKTITDLNGDVLSFSADGITHSSGIGIAYTRDEQNRIIQITDPISNTLSYQYDQNSDLVQVVDQENFTTTYTYLDNHYLYKIIDPDGQEVLALDYEGDGRLKEICNTAGECNRVTHNFEGNYQETIDPTGRSERFAYDSQGNVISRTNALGHTRMFEYDQAGNLISEADATGAVTSYTYDSHNNRLSMIEPHEEGEQDADFTTTYTYNARDQVTSVSLPTGAQFLYTYDSRGNLEEILDEEGNQLLGLTYDSQGRITAEHHAFDTITYSEHNSLGDPTHIVHSTGEVFTATYDTMGQITAMAVNGVTSTYSYDGRGRETFVDLGDGIQAEYTYGYSDEWVEFDSSVSGHMEREFNASNRPTRLEGPNGTSVNIVYDAAGRPTQVTDPGGNITGYEYDLVGQLRSVSSPSGATTTYAYDPAGRIIAETDALDYATHFTYTPNGRIDSFTTPLSQTWRFNHTITTTTITDPLNRQTTQIFSPRGLPVQTINPDGTSSKITYLLTSPLIDAENFPTTITDEGGHVRRYSYNDFGQLTGATDLAGITTTYSYDSNGLTSITWPTNESTHFTYDELGNPASVTFPDGGIQRFNYGTNNLPYTMTQPSGVTITYTYDLMDNLVSRISSLGEQETFAWEPNGLLTQTVDATGTTTYAYNEDGYLTRIEYPEGGEIQYGRDLLGQVLTLTVRPSDTSPGYTTYYAYDAVGNLTSIIDPLSGQTTIQYDAIGRPLTRTLPNGITTVFTYNDQDQITSIVHTNGNDELLASVTYERQGVGEPTRIIREDGSYVILDYDEALRLHSERYYDPSNILVEAIDYTYDTAGNRQVYSSTLGISTYQYDPGYQLTGVTSTLGNETYTYDADGRVSSLARGQTAYTFDYNSQDQITAVTDIINGTTISYTYDALGRRVQATDASGIRRFLVAPALGEGLESPHVVADENGSLLFGYVYAGEFPLLRFDANGPVYYLFDGMGSTIGMADDNGASIANFHYDTFGNLRSASGSQQSPPITAGGDFRFHGNWLETSTGLYHFRARDYDPHVGRFISRDAAETDLRQPENQHPYVFANNNPHIYRDPTGFFSIISFNITFSIQGIIQGMRTAALNYIRNWAKDKIGEAVVNILVEALEGLLPISLDWSHGPLSAGTDLGKQIEGALCAVIKQTMGHGVASAFWFEPHIQQSNGKAVGNGRNCGAETGPQSRPGGNRPGDRRPDFLIKQGQPIARSSRTWAVGDVKLSVTTLYRAYGPGGYNREQWQAIWKHARNYAYFPHITMFITLYKGDRTSRRWLRDEAIRRRVGMVIIILK